MYSILLLEDDLLFASSIEDFLVCEGFCVDIAKDGEEVFDFTFHKNYDLYIFDINVPKINGLELLEQLRTSGDNTPSIFLTSYKDKDTLQTAFLNGCDDYLKKPADLDELLLRIKALLKRNKKQFDIINLSKSITFNPANKRVYENDVDLNLSPFGYNNLLNNTNEKIANFVDDNSCNLDLIKHIDMHHRNTINSQNKISRVQIINSDDVKTVFKIGDLVTHLKFGRGKILSLHVDSKKTTAEIFFIGLGKKRLDLNIAKIEKCK